TKSLPYGLPPIVSKHLDPRDFVPSFLVCGPFMLAIIKLIRSKTLYFRFFC
ncbi:MAG: hypothetical protein ACJAW2_000519, partial [Shewanella sp.]